MGRAEETELKETERAVYSNNKDIQGIDCRVQEAGGKEGEKIGKVQLLQGSATLVKDNELSYLQGKLLKSF